MNKCIITNIVRVPRQLAAIDIRVFNKCRRWKDTRTTSVHLRFDVTVAIKYNFSICLRLKRTFSYLSQIPETIFFKIILYTLELLSEKKPVSCMFLLGLLNDSCSHNSQIKCTLCCHFICF